RAQFGGVEVGDEIVGAPRVARRDVGAAAEAVVVMDDQLAVARGMDVELDHRAAERGRLLEGGERVLGGEGARAAVADDDRASRRQRVAGRREQGTGRTRAGGNGLGADFDSSPPTAFAKPKGPSRAPSLRYVWRATR